MGKSHKHPEILEQDDTEFDSDYQNDDFDEAEIAMKLDDEVSELQREIEIANALENDSNPHSRSLPNDWQDFEPSSWDDSDLYS